MRIDDLNRTPVAQGAQQAEQAPEKRASDKNSLPAAGADQVTVSSLAHALSAQDPQRLEQLRLQVQSGKYSVPSDALANSIIDGHLKE
ncbi:MAG TPA: flagellar biosynthesis anti-sigma factor FlgM [Bryobacteraceae bacterium]|nr:flagellar biosynthesis anti-sigma factor FlgM [Bryobacteraceae bacterium]